MKSLYLKFQIGSTLFRQDYRFGEKFTLPPNAGLIGRDFDRDCFWYAPKPWHLWYRFLDWMYGRVYCRVLRFLKWHGFLRVTEGSISNPLDWRCWGLPWDKHHCNFRRFRKSINTEAFDKEYSAAAKTCYVCQNYGYWNVK